MGPCDCKIFAKLSPNSQHMKKIISHWCWVPFTAKITPIFSTNTSRKPLLVVMEDTFCHGLEMFKITVGYCFCPCLNISLNLIKSKLSTFLTLPNRFLNPFVFKFWFHQIVYLFSDHTNAFRVILLSRVFLGACQGMHPIFTVGFR